MLTAFGMLPPCKEKCEMNFDVRGQGGDHDYCKVFISHVNHQVILVRIGVSNERDEVLRINVFWVTHLV
jgi:hypothetical protein